MDGLTHEQKQVAKAMWKKHGGNFFGPHVEHVSMEEQAFYRFLEEWKTAQLPAVAKTDAPVTEVRMVRSVQDMFDPLPAAPVITDLSVEVEASPGSDCRSVCAQMVALADKLGVVVRSKMNGVIVLAKPGADGKALGEEWDRVLQSDMPYKIACVQPRPAAISVPVPEPEVPPHLAVAVETDKRDIKIVKFCGTTYDEVQDHIVAALRLVGYTVVDPDADLGDIVKRWCVSRGKVCVPVSPTAEMRVKMMEVVKECYVGDGEYEFTWARMDAIWKAALEASRQK